MKIEINVKDGVYRSYWPPYKADFDAIRRDIEPALDKLESVILRDDVTSASIKITHYGEEVGTLTFSEG